MTMEALESDLEEIKAETKKLGPLTTTNELVTFVQKQLVPFIEAHVAESSEMDGCIADLIDRTEDILQPETAQLFAAVIIGGRGIAAKLAELLPRNAAGDIIDQPTVKVLANWEQIATAAERVLEEITMHPEEEDDEDEPEDGEGEGDEDEDGDDEADDEGDQP